MPAAGMRWSGRAACWAIRSAAQPSAAKLRIHFMGLSLRSNRIAAVVREKVAVDQLAPGEAFVRGVPEIDIVFIHAPAEVNFAPAIKSREIDEPHAEIFHQHAPLFHSLEERLERLRAGIALRFPRLGAG